MQAEVHFVPSEKRVRVAAGTSLLEATQQAGLPIANGCVANGLCAVYAQGSTAAIMIQEGWDPSVPTDVVNLLKELIPQGEWLHDRQDDNGDSHLKAGLVGPSETIPVIDGRLALSRWQNVFFCEFDGPRPDRPVVVTVMGEVGKAPA